MVAAVKLSLLLATACSGPWLERAAAAAGEKVVLSGVRRLENGRWGEVNGRKAWVVDIPEVKAGTWRFRQLFVNGERQPRTRLPEQGEYHIQALPDVPIADETWGMAY